MKFKSLLVSLAFLFVITPLVYSYEETVDIDVSTECVDVVSITSMTWTVIFSSVTDLFKSTTTTGNANNTYSISYYNVRNNANADTDVAESIDNSKAASDCWIIRDTEVITFRSRKTRYARLLAGQGGTVNVIVEKNYIGGR